jgi:hypothetical protein
VAATPTNPENPVSDTTLLPLSDKTSTKNAENPVSETRFPEVPAKNAVAAAPVPPRDVVIELWRASRMDQESARRRSWQTVVVLGPLAFGPLVLLTRVQCPLPLDFILLGGSSFAILFLWVYLAERCAADREQAAAQLASISVALALPVPGRESRALDRLVRLLLTMTLAALWIWSWSARPDCSTESWTDEPSEMSRT